MHAAFRYFAHPHANDPVRSFIKIAPVRIRIAPNCAQNDDAIKDAKTMQVY